MSDFFTSSDGFIKKMQGVVDNLGLAGGPILTRENNITNQESIVDQRIVREDARLENTKKNLMKQYSALDLFIQHYQQIGNFLEQQIDSLKSFRPR